MRAAIVYESMYGNTRQIAEEIAEAFGPDDVVRVLAVSSLDPNLDPNLADIAQGIDLLVVGGPTHAHSLSRPMTRQAASDATLKPDAGVTMEPGATGRGLREWFTDAGPLPVRAAAYDTRLDAPPIFTGRAAHGIEKRLHKHGAYVICEAEAFLVDKRNRLLPGELDRARAWGTRLREIVSADLAPGARSARAGLVNPRRAD